MTASNFATRFRRAAAEQNGMALVVTLMVMMLVSVLMVGFVTAIIADQRASGLDRDQTQAYAVAHAGLEQLTSDLNALFVRDVSPNKTQLSALTTTPPSVTGFGFCAPTDTDCQPDDNSGYSITFIPDAAGNPRPEDPINGSPITAGPYQGLQGSSRPTR
jgi:type II secretory pathway pseudopilin PulG